ncbi:glycine--tRNA ligase [Candidatus Nanohalococcus occultus]|uniref:glycine--tRNA ligase n=1 Tax=Candidatus Nanohalococcus occultus TaxID=2978047 RepID=UPI0039E07260
MNSELRQLIKRRGFYFLSQESYGGSAGFYTYGPEGASLKANIEDAWRDRFKQKESNMEIDSPTIMKEAVFDASGHTETFDDMIIECEECGEQHRADHLVEDNTEIDEAEAFAAEKIEEIIEDENIQCPSCGASLSGIKVNDFNLMFETSIGPGDAERGFLRPETAQGIFVEFPRLKEYARNDFPFGVVQIGRSYRNEISPRGGLSRVREFTQAELENFILPGQEPDISDVEDVELRLYSRKLQDEGAKPAEMTVKESLEKDVVASEWVAYYLGVAQRWYERIGVDPERLRFRQHQEDELSHYASDCWDAETDVGHEEKDWLEITGFAFRGCHDVKQHHNHSNEDYRVFREYDKPKEVEVKDISPDMSYFGPEYGDQAGKVIEKLEELVGDSPEVFEQETLEIEVSGEELDVPSEKAGFSQRTEEKDGEKVFPQVVEPSFGVDRIFYSILVHSFEQDEVDGEERNVLRLEREVAPVEVAVMPLMDKDGLGEKAEEIRDKLQRNGFRVDYDDSGSIGRRYRRQDEVGTPYCVTVDYETLEDKDVTLRDRDSTEQQRVEIGSLAEKLRE